MKRFLTGMLCAGILTSQPAVTYAAETSATPEAGHSETYSQASDIDSVKGWPTGPNIEGQSAVLMDAVTDTILYSKNAKDKLYPASITKIMTALLACEYLNMDDTITMSQEARKTEIIFFIVFLLSFFGIDPYFCLKCKTLILQLLYMIRFCLSMLFWHITYKFYL